MLWEKTGEKPIELQIKKRKWKWIGRTIRRIKMQLRGLCWIGTLRARGREEDQRRLGRGQSWKRHREKEGCGGR
jgi:hypothetical protein